MLEYGTASNGGVIGIKIARAGGSNAAYQRVLERKLKPYRRQLQTDTMDNKVAERILIEVFAETVVVGWENVEDAKGKQLEYNVENVIKVLTDLPDLFADIQKAASDAALFRKDALEADAKN